MDNAINCVLKLCLKAVGPFPAKCHNCLVLEAFKAVRILSFLSSKRNTVVMVKVKFFAQKI